MFKSPNNIQFIDSSCNLIFPWYTKPFLDELIKMNFKNWEVFEWGGGCSTIWYSYNCKHVDTLETSKLWSDEIVEYLKSNNKTNYTMKVVEVPGSANIFHPNMDDYLNYIDTLNKQWDCIVIDGSYRNDALIKSEKYVKRGGIIIFDNFEQNTSGYPILPNKCYFEKYKLNIFEHPTLTEWKTAYWIID